MKKVLTTFTLTLFLIISLTIKVSAETSIYQELGQEIKVNDYGFNQGFRVIEGYDIEEDKNYYTFNFLSSMPYNTFLADYNKVEIYLPNLSHQIGWIASSYNISYVYEDPNDNIIDNAYNFSRISFIRRGGKLPIEIPIYDELIDQSISTSFYIDSEAYLSYNIIDNSYIEIGGQRIYVDDIVGINISFNTDIYEDDFDKFDCIIYEEGNENSVCNITGLQEFLLNVDTLFRNNLGKLGEDLARQWSTKVYGDGLKINYYYGLSLIDTLVTFENSTFLNQPKMNDTEELIFSGWRYKNNYITSLEQIDVEMLDSNGELNLQAVYLTPDGDTFTMPSSNEGSNIILSILEPFNMNNVFGTSLLFIFIIMAFTILVASLKGSLMLYLIGYLGFTILWLVLGLLPLFMAIIIFLISAIMFIYITGGKNYE